MIYNDVYLNQINKQIETIAVIAEITGEIRHFTY